MKLDEKEFDAAQRVAELEMLVSRVSKYLMKRGIRRGGMKRMKGRKKESKQASKEGKKEVNK